MRKLHFLLGLCFCLAGAGVHAETLTLTDGATLSGDILRFDDEGLMLRLADDNYTNLAWSQFSQASLKDLSQNEKMARLVEPFIEPSEPDHPPQAAITINPVSRLQRPEHPSLILGLLQSPVGWFIILMLYAANLFAAYEIALFKLRKLSEVMVLCAVLPLVGPVIFMALPEKAESAPETAPSEAVMVPAGSLENPQAEIPMVEITQKVEEKKPEPQVFARGKFTFNKRFMETKFAAFIGQPKGDALQFSMQMKTGRDQLEVDRILQVSTTEVVLTTVQRNQMTVLLADIQEVKLIPKGL